MSFPQVINRTGFTFMPQYLTDEEARPLLVLVARATLDIDFEGRLHRSAEPAPIVPAGLWAGVPGESSYLQEPDVAFTKHGTDVVMIGSARVAHRPVTTLDVSLRVGPVRKVVRVHGDRQWVRGLTGFRATEALRFESMPLLYERAYGGWDRTAADPARHEVDSRNPVGRGFCSRRSSPLEGLMLPNLEDPANLISSPGDRPPPSCFGFTSMHWQPRARWAGTFDASWQRDRSPRLPNDFDRRYFGGAAENQQIHPYLRGDEAMVAHGVRAAGPLSCNLPALGPACFSVRLRMSAATTVDGALDTVVVDADRPALQLTWRAHVVLPRGAHDVVELGLSFPGASSPSRHLLLS